MTRFLYIFLLIGLLMPLAGCSTFKNIFGEEKDVPLKGERISVLDLQKDLEPDDSALTVQEFQAPQQWKNEFWPQAGGYPSHSMQHLALSEGRLKLAWKNDIGKGSSKNFPLNAQPVIVDGKIYTLDTEQRLAATDMKTGATIWDKKVKSKTEDDLVISGGISYSRGALYVTNGYNEIMSVSPDNGKTIWRKTLSAPARAAPTIMDGRVFVATLDNKLVALNTEDGATLWEFSGLAETAGLVGAASPAASGEIVVPAFSSGELFALRVENGTMVWSENLAALRQAGGLGSVSDIRGLPVIDNGMVIAVSFGGRLVAIDARSGARIWSREIGSSESPWVAGNYVFVISLKNELVALARETGIIRWVKQLQQYENPEDRKGTIFWTSPVFAGNRLISASSNGKLIEVDPASGKVIRETETDHDIRIAPIVAGKTLYLLAENGMVLAYR